VSSDFTASPDTSDYRSDTCDAPPSTSTSAPPPLKLLPLNRTYLIRNLIHKTLIIIILPTSPVSIASDPTSVSSLQPFAAVLENVLQTDEAFSVSPPSTNLDALPHPRRIHCLRFMTLLPLVTRKTAARLSATRPQPLTLTPPSASPHLLRPVPTTTSTVTSFLRPFTMTRSRLNVSMARLHLLLRLYLCLSTLT